MLCLFSFGCSVEATNREDAIREQEILPTTASRGDTTVQQHSPEATDRAPRFRLDSAAIGMVTSDADGAFDLSSAGQPLLLPDGRIVVLDVFGNRVLVFGADGRGERRLGRSGGGPGEFSRVEGVGHVGSDTLLVSDAGNARFSWWTTGGALIAERLFPSSPVIPPFTSFVGTLPDGRIVMHSGDLLRPGVTDSVTRPPAPVLIVNPRASTGGEVFQVPGPEVLRVVPLRGRPRNEPVQLGLVSHVAVWDTLLAVATGQTSAVDLRHTDGRLVSTIRLGRPRRTVTRAMRDTVVAQKLAEFKAQRREGGVDPEPRRRAIREAPFADSLPPFGGLHVTPDRKTLWVLDARAPGDTVWAATRLRLDGAITGRVVATGHARPIAFGNDYVVLRVEDADGVASFRMHRLIPSPR